MTKYKWTILALILLAAIALVLGGWTWDHALGFFDGN